MDEVYGTRKCHAQARRRRLEHGKPRAKGATALIARLRQQRARKLDAQNLSAPCNALPVRKPLARIACALQSRKDDRIAEFVDYNVYNSYETAVNADIYQEGELVVMLILNDEDKTIAKGIIDSYLLEHQL